MGAYAERWVLCRKMDAYAREMGAYAEIWVPMQRDGCLWGREMGAYGVERWVPMG
jgi:hypothetical protein